MQRHRTVPHVLWDHDRSRGGFLMVDERTGEEFWGPDGNAVEQFAADRSAQAGYYGAGDAVAAVANPIANFFGVKKADCGCAGKQQQLNQMFPAVRRR